MRSCQGPQLSFRLRPARLDELGAPELDEPGCRWPGFARRSVKRVPFGGPSREAKQIVQPLQGQTAGTAKRDSGFDVRGSHDGLPFIQRRLDLPPQTKGKISRVEQ
jgi:hypothetical protein